MKILQVIQRYPPSVGGSQHVCYRLSKELTKLGHEVTVVTTSSLNNRDIIGLYAKGFNLKFVNNHLPDSSIEDNIEVFRFKPLFQILTRLFNPSLFLFLCKNLDKYDLIHAHCYTTSELDYCSLIMCLKGINKPYIITAHDVITPYKGVLGFLKDFYDKTIGRLSLNSANKLIALTTENLNQYTNLGINREKVAVIPNGIDFLEINRNKAKIKKKRLYGKNKVCLFVGRLVEYKGAQHIIMSAPKVLKKFPNTSFIFIGEDQGYKNILVEEAKRLNISDKCIFKGKVSNEELAEHYAMADVFILPSTGEGFGLTAVEAMHYGTPVILANEGGLKWILEEVGGYPINMKLNIKGQIANSILKIFTNNKRLTESKDIKDRFDWSKVVKELERTYYEIS